MENRRDYIEKWRTDYDFKTFVNSFGSTLVTFAFAVFNGILGIMSGSAWYISIAIYYAMLCAIRSFLILSGRSGSDGRRIQIIASASLLLLDTSLGAPIAFLIRNQKPLSANMTFVLSITIAAYTTFKITMAAVNQARKRKKSSNKLVRILRTINFIDALVSVLVLQNTLILVNSTDGGASMKSLTIITGTAIWLAIIALSASTFISAVRRPSN